ncbi:hypothetical protein [Streptomyces yunnanensis]|nr:hypothetical protein [Streptomyces yunnanensis]
MGEGAFAGCPQSGVVAVELLVLIFDGAFDDLVMFGIPGVWGLELAVK